MKTDLMVLWIKNLSGDTYDLYSVQLGDQPSGIFTGTYRDILPPALMWAIFNCHCPSCGKEKLEKSQNRKLGILFCRSCLEYIIERDEWSDGD